MRDSIHLFVYFCRLLRRPLFSARCLFLRLSPPSAYKWIHGELKGNVPFQYLAWVTYPMILVVFASLFCHLVSPQAIGKAPLLPPVLPPPLLILSSDKKLFSFFFQFLCRFWYSGAENHPERSRAEGVSHPQGLRG